MSISPFSFLDSGLYSRCYRKLAVSLGTVPGVFLSELIDTYNFCSSQGTLVDHKAHGEGWFYQTIEWIQDRIGATRREQETAIKKLTQMGIIEVKVFGVPAKRYFRINTAKVLEYFGLTVLKHTMAESAKLECAKRENRPVQNVKTGHIYNNTKEEPKKKKYIRMLPHAKKIDDPSPPPLISKIEKARKVFVTQEEHDSLVAKHGELLTKEAYETLAVWKESADPKKVGRHSDFGRIKTWVMKNVYENQAASKKLAREISYQQKQPNWKVPNHPKDNYKPEEL